MNQQIIAVFSVMNDINALCSSVNLKITFTYFGCCFLLPFGFKTGRWFENVRTIDVFCAISRLRGINIL